MLKIGLVVRALACLVIASQGTQADSPSESGQGTGRQVPAWYTNLCRENGLTDTQQRQLLQDLSMPDWVEELGGRVAGWKASDADIVPILIALTEEREPPLLGTGPDSLPVYPYKMVRWLGLLRDERASAHLLAMTREALAKGVTTAEESSSLDYLFVAVGWSGSDEAVKFLWRAQTDDFWQDEEAPRVDLPAYGTRSAEQKTADCVERLKSAAFRALAETRRDSVLNALATGEGLNPRFAAQFAEQFEYAARRTVGIVGYPEVVGKPLSEEQHEKLRTIFAKYDVEYKPIPVKRSPSYPASNHDPPPGYNKKVTR